MAARDMTWPGFFKRQAKYTLGVCAIFLFFWNSLVIWEWLYALFGGELRGYGPGQQRWHRVWAVGFVGMYLFGSLLDFIGVWYWQKYPEKRRQLEEGDKQKQKERKNEKTYKAENSPMRASFIESTAAGDIVHRAELSKTEQGYALRLCQAGQDVQQDDRIEKFESEQAVKQYLEQNTSFRWGDFVTPATIEKNRQANEEIPPIGLLMDKLGLSGIFGSLLITILVIKFVPALTEDGMNDVLRSFVIVLAAVFGWWIGRRCSRLFKRK
ncbi:hypothetical protein L861_14720 [Litchfieldella anticariensis FP35 = DSM 16096]|uniref:Uncharacterized protein n=1 Tax=Litchfieldella anticariensis (strain DSM 16096 / CECT 5854 / CIP 108499 / LMG 22089 / FP35) TaxID=1121939 RepID=S2KE94_LITA3|nr:hypothetical protein [Halomonas anticariensis]EPC00180.1 hypothetical protein L861_14720 [Halomonas anticariensis FP35 = DSM 16096]